MNIQSVTVRKYVLERLEDGSFSAGMRLPGSRKISEELNISRPVVQNALDTLVSEGILKAAQRSGLYVEENWKYRTIQGSLRIYTRKYLPWLAMFRAKIERELPQLHISTEFPECPFEIITTTSAQSRHNEFIDLMPVLKECYPDLTPFHAEQLKPFIHDGRLTALPFLFSPRIMVCRRKMLAAANCPEPTPEWSLDDLLEICRKLQKHDPSTAVFHWGSNLFDYMNFILGCGGRLFDPDSADPVKFDSPEARKGLKYFRMLRPFRPAHRSDPLSALSVVTRQNYARDFRGRPAEDFLFLPIPGDTPERTGTSIQATELFAIRRNGVDRGVSKPIVRFLWSEEFQDHLAELQYGIPIRKSSSRKTFTGQSPADAVFKQACRQICSNYQLYDTGLMNLITRGIGKILSGNGDLDRDISELAQTVRKYISYMKVA